MKSVGFNTRNHVNCSADGKPRGGSYDAEKPVTGEGNSSFEVNLRRMDSPRFELRQLDSGLWNVYVIETPEPLLIGADLTHEQAETLAESESKLVGMKNFKPAHYPRPKTSTGW